VAVEVRVLGGRGGGGVWEFFTATLLAGGLAWCVSRVTAAGRSGAGRGGGGRIPAATVVTCAGYCCGWALGRRRCGGRGRRACWEIFYFSIKGNFERIFTLKSLKTKLST
jgi:hypothetical protein